LKNKSSTIIFVQFSYAIFSISVLFKSRIFIVFQKFSITLLLIICIFDTDEIEAIASHLNQKVMTLYKSSKFLILDVECFSQIISKSSLSIQIQSSLIIIFFVHHSVISIFMFFAPASIEFSSISFMTETCFSTTSHLSI